ncbi:MULTISPECIES: hypothetical protein [Methanobacterium]|uniref:hypothetical protein n=1 Tax=Methanobacterium TaxID=2160 RepID=UPI000746DAED|nr:hypothetical protein [Methanobacterium sp. 42_16]KUK74978.1 MAG: Uncharacterized protein XD90_0748 [Methanobacterium sp. 42_16]
MDDKGFIFTADATLALVVVIVFTASIVVYGLLPVYQGQDHQHLQALADSALATMEEDGTLRDAAVYYANNNSTAAQDVLSSSLNSILPSYVSYKISVGDYGSISQDRGRDYLLSSNVATGVRVISGPEEGWLGRSFYNIKEVGLTKQDTNVTTTLWNFHNWLTNFDPWDNWGGLSSYPYWGSNGGSGYRTIDFSVPNATSINWAKFIINSVNKNDGTSYGAGVNINGNNYNVAQNQFQYLYNQNDYRFYNNLSSINTNALAKGSTNKLYVHYTSASSSNDMAWFSLIANYTVSMMVPQGVVTNTYYFNDAAGLAYPDEWVWNGRRWVQYPGRVSGIIYTLLTGGVSSFTANSGRSFSYYDYTHNHPAVADGTPFVLTSTPGNYAASAVAIEKEVDNRDAGTIKDAYLVMNPYGGMDGARVEVYHPMIGSTPGYWETVFSSEVNTQTGTDSGYGNLPGTINLKDHLDKGYVNKVRITAWDNVPSSGSNDYDLVGLTNCYVVVSSSKLPIWWDEYGVESEQSRTNSISKDITYEIRANGTNGAKEAYLFFSGGLDTKNVKVTYADTGQVLYDGATPYMLNLGELDAASIHKMTVGTPSNHTYQLGNYTIRVLVTSGQGWESGDAYAEIFSGTRVAVIYPALEQAVWSTKYAPTAQEAIDRAYQALMVSLEAQGFKNIDQSLVSNETLYTGDLPNAIPVRLDLWTS